MYNRDERFDALITELHVLVSIWNMQVYWSLEYPYVPFGIICWEVEQAALAQHLNIGKRTLERACSRLVEAGRLKRSQLDQKSPFAYQTSREAISELTLELLMRGAIHVHELPNGMFWVDVIRSGDLFPNGENEADFL